MARNVEFNEEEAVAKAMEVFWKKGYTGASMRDLTDAMKINSSSLYNTIGDKHALFVRCIKSYTKESQEEAIKRAKSAKTPMAAIINEINGSVNKIYTRENCCMAIKTTFEIAAEDPEVLAIIKENSDFTYNFILNLLKDAATHGELAENADPEVLTDYLLSALTGWNESYIVHQDAGRIQKMVNYLIRQISR